MTSCKSEVHSDFSHPTQKICTQIRPIPLPADDCDRLHSMHAALSSLDAAAASFDAALDALAATSARHRQRICDLERRLAAFRACLRRLDALAASKRQGGQGLDDEILVMFCPGSYESALRGMDTELAKVHEALDLNQQLSTGNAARSVADAAVQECLTRDVQMDNGQAVPSDAWLDRASTGLGVGKALEATNLQRSVPLLSEENFSKGEAEYRRELDALAQNSTVNRQEGVGRVESLEESSGGDYRGDDESVYSVTSQISSMSMVTSTRMTAGQRRRWHKQQSMKGRTKVSATQMHPVLASHPEAVSPVSAVAGRQQSLVGSHPYLCEVFHDSYGIGLEPAHGLVECSGFSARNTSDKVPSSITDLLVFNTTKNSYEGVMSHE